MSLELLPGKELAQAKQESLRVKLANPEERKRTLAIIQVGSEPSSTLYVNKKLAAAAAVGMHTRKIDLPVGSEPEVREAILELNRDQTVTGMIVQAPLPGIPARAVNEIFNTILPEKDVDGLTAANLGRLFQLKELVDLTAPNAPLAAATPLGCLDAFGWFAQRRNRPELTPAEFFAESEQARLLSLQTFLTGKTALIINRSTIVGKPLAALLTAASATVTLAHSRTPNLESQIKNFDIVISATGVSHIFSTTQFRPGQIILDVGINSKDTEGVINGDIKLDDADLEIAGVPGGIGPLTVANLLANTAR